MISLPFTATVLALAVSASAATPEPVTPDQAKQGLQKAIPFLLDSADPTIKSNINGKGCVACHWTGAALLGVNAAHRRGLVEAKEVEKFEPLLRKLSTRKLVYQLNDKSMAALKTAGVGEKELTEFKKKHFPTLEAFQADLAKFLKPDVLEAQQEEIGKKAANPNFYELESNLMASTTLVAGAAAKTSAPAEITKGLAERLSRIQAKDGSITEGGQPLFPQADEKIECDTIWCVLALSSVEPKSDEIKLSIERGKEFLKKTKQGKSTVSLVLRTLLAHQMKDAPSVTANSSQLLKEQQADGGWSSWDRSKGDRDSDALATGMVLHMLGTIGTNSSDASVQRAWAYLLKTQEKDGSWATTNAKGRSERIYTYWGTTWAVMGLMETVPNKQ
jgi:hypothetical protein